jgi:ubiquinone/menaquinone biosynthesis C-methylase UbiE
LTEKLNFTGERFTPDCEREIWYEHFHRYVFARSLVAGKTVLDAACGEGYGSALLARTANNVVGIDLAADTIDHAKSTYSDLKNLQFQQGDCTALNLGDDSFDVVISFETLEHLTAQKTMLKQFRRVLKEDGFLVISSPDKKTYSDAAGSENPFHVKELYRDELESLITSEFPAYQLLGQKLVFQSAIWDMNSSSKAVIEQLDESGAPATKQSLPHEPVYYVAICAAAEVHLPDVADRLWLFSDTEESVYQHYYHEIRKNMAAGGVLEQYQAQIRELEARLSAADQQPSTGWFGRMLKRITNGHE